VTVAVPAAPDAALAACADLVQRLPGSLGEGLERRELHGDASRAAAWGDPAIILTCGVVQAGQPGVDGEPVFLARPDGGQLEFLVDDVGAASRWLTVGRTVAVSLDVPDAYDAQAVQSLLGPLLESLPVAADLGD
jgi:hypothetical protein